MNPPSSMKIRLVRCPRCLRVLEELPDISLYRCGGCGTILQAKHRKMEASHTVNSVAKIQQEDSFPEEEEEDRSSDLDFPSPHKEESSPDKDNIGFQDEAVESSSEQSEYRSAYNGLSSSPDVNREKGECSLQHDSEICANKLNDSDEDSTGGGNFSGEIPSSTEASEWVKEHENIYFDPTATKDVEQSPRVWQGGGKFVDEVGIFYGREHLESRLRHDADHEHREGIDDNYAHLEHDTTVSENEATSSNHDLTTAPKEESSSDRDSRIVSSGLLSMPDVDHCRHEDSPVRESVNHDKVKCCFGLDSKRYARELDESDGESSTGGNISWEIPSSSELVYQGINEVATETKRAEKNEKIYFDQPTKRDQWEDVESSDYQNGWPPVNAEHTEGICNYYVNLENKDVSQEEARSSNHGLSFQCKEKSLHHDERVESINEQYEDRTISNGLLSLTDVKFCESKDMVESLNHDDSQDSDSGLLNLDEDEKSFLDGPKEVGLFEGGESPLGVCQKSDNLVHKVQNISEHEAQENGLSTIGIKKHITSNHVHLGHDDDVSKEVVRNYVHLENDDVSKDLFGSSNHDLTSPPNEELSLHKANIQFQDGHLESRKEFSVGSSSVSNDLSSSPQVNQGPLMEESLYKDQGRSSLAPDMKRHGSELIDLDGESSEGGNISGEIHSSTELVYRETEELIPEAVQHAKECNKSYLDQPTNVEPFEGEKSWRVYPEGDNIMQNFSRHEGIWHAGVGSSAAEVVSHEDGNASPVDDGGFKGNPSVGDTIVASQVVLMGMPANLTSLVGKYVDRSPMKGSRNFGSASSVELLGDSLCSETSPERRVKPKDTTSPVTTRGYYGYDGSESSNDETDGGQIPLYIRHSSRRKGKEFDYSSTTLEKEGFVEKNMLRSEPETKYWTPNKHRVTTGSHGNPDEFTETKIRVLSGGDTTRLNEGGYHSQLPFTSRNLHANQRLRNHSVYRNNLPPPHPGFNPPDKTSYSEPDKMDLLRTVCELKDQLNRIQFPNISRDRITREKFSPSPFYYDHLKIPGRERYVDFNHHGNYQWYDHEKGRVEQSNVSALALSGEAEYYRHQVNCSCLHCRTRNWHSSAPLLPHSSHYHGRSVAHIGHNSRNMSSPSIPQNYTSYECAVWGHETMPDYQRHIDNEMRRFYLREKCHASKKHLRPVSGGSPFLTCYRCSEILQLPADFLVLRKRYHQLRCNACSKVLKFSLLGGKHIVPYLPQGLGAGDSSDVTNERSLLLMPHSNFCQHGEPVSCSDDYDQSFSRSCSTEGEASSVLAERNRYNRKISSVSSYEAIEDRKMKSIMRDPMDKEKNKNSVETFESVGTSSEQPKFAKPSSEIEEFTPSPTFPLHRLMGYSSISQVLNKGSD